MSHFVPRTCTEIGEDGAPIEPKRTSDDSIDWFGLLGGGDSSGESESPARSLERYRECDAYVLLGAPGAGKTVSFRREADCGEGRYVTARDFIALDARPEGRDTTLFIDGLDEMRAGAADGRTPLDAIRAKLDGIGRPRFRLSCREADWFGANDRAHLKSVSRGGEVKVLRLDPLSEDGIHELLAHQASIEDTDGFITTARERGIDGLLANPQSLLMIAQAVAGGSWPDTRKETFELACNRLVREHNDEHWLAERGRAPSESELLDAAGRLCAVQLLTGRAEYFLFGDASGSEYLGLQQVSGGAQETFRHVLGTKLFEAPGENRVAPTHRQIAEFLAGRYLSKLIHKGLSLGRILALMTGEDGGIVSELRGLSAWLAAHSKTSRREVIDRDPLGTVLYGDVGGFSCEEKHHVLVCLDREAKRNPWFANTLGIDHQLGSLATPDMKEVFRSFLTDPRRSDAQQSIVLMLLQSLIHGRMVPDLDDLLIEVVRDEERWPDVRLCALDAFIRHQESSTDAGELKILLADVYLGSVLDPDGDLLGSLLVALYPENLTVSDILEYLDLSRDFSHGSSYLQFWHKHLPKKSDPVRLAELLDALAERFAETDPASWESRQKISIGQLVLCLLAHLLYIAQENVSPKRLFLWLMIAKSEIWNSSGEARFVQTWLTSHPEVQKEIVAASIEYCTGSRDFISCMYDQIPYIYNSIHNELDFQYWLDQAMSATEPGAAEYFIQAIARFVHEGLSRAIVEGHLADRSDLLEILAVVEEKKAKARKDAARLQERISAPRKKEQDTNHDFIKPHETALKENRCNPELLHWLATHYFHSLKTGDSEERLLDVFGKDEGLIEAILAGLRGAVGHPDVPGAMEIIRLRKKNRTHHMVLPFLAGLEELARTRPIDRVFSDKEQIRQALAFYYTRTRRDPFGWHERPEWYGEVLKSHTELAAETLVQSVRAAMLAAAESSLPSLFGVFRLRDSGKIARLASIPLLEAFPIRCSNYQLPELGYLAGKALEHCDAMHLLKIVDRKIAYRSLPVGQRVCWLAIGLLASNSTNSVNSYQEALKKYLIGKERRVQYLANFLKAMEFDSPLAIIEFPDISTLQLLIQFLGVSYGPASLTSNSRISTYFLVRSFIDRLASIPSPDAVEAIKTLAEDEALRSWRAYLADAGYRQNIVCRKAKFRHADVDQVLGTLDNGRPSNAADLAALTFEILTELARNIRDGNTSDWRQYWSLTQDRHSQPDRPLHEDHCQDRLLSDLRSRLEPLGIDAEPEGRYADEKRSDIRVSCGGFNVPVEIKKSDHRNLWSAIRSQLIAKYTRDPGASGYGIYLVFWFGKEHCQPPESGPRPSSAAELEKRLRDTLSPEEARMIGICVIDVSIPPDKRKQEG